MCDVTITTTIGHEYTYKQVNIVTFNNDWLIIKLRNNTVTKYINGKHILDLTITDEVNYNECK